MSDKLATVYIWITVLVSVVAIGMMLALGDTDVQANRNADMQQTKEAFLPDKESNNGEFYVMDSSLPENSLSLRLPADTAQQYVTIEKKYMDRTLCIKVSKQMGTAVSESYFMNNPALVNMHIESAELKETEDEVCLSLQLGVMVECETKFEAGADYNCLNLQMIRPKDKYEKVIVLDAGHGGEDCGYTITGEDESMILSEEDLVFSVVTKAGVLLEKEGVCVYYTRSEHENPSEKKRVEFANEAQADMLISVHADYAEDTSIYGMRTIYNETYFIPEFASSDLAYLLLEKVAASTNEKALGFEVGTEESELIQLAMVPVAQLNIGYLSNKQEQKLLAKEDYIDRIAQGICDTVLAGYEEMQK